VKITLIPLSVATAFIFALNYTSKNSSNMDVVLYITFLKIDFGAFIFLIYTQ
jgi:hypothetical protein